MTIQDFQDRLCGYRPTLQQARAEFAVLSSFNMDRKR